MLFRSVIEQLPHHIDFAARRKDLKIAEARKRGGDAADHRARLGFGTSVVEHVADDRLARGDQTQRARGRHAERVHGLAAQEFAQRGAQHRTAIGAARVGCEARALELQFLALPALVDHFAERDRAAVAELPGPGAELEKFYLDVVCRVLMMLIFFWALPLLQTAGSPRLAVKIVLVHISLLMVF